MIPDHCVSQKSEVTFIIEMLSITGRLWLLPIESRELRKSRVLDERRQWRVCPHGLPTQGAHARFCRNSFSRTCVPKNPSGKKKSQDLIIKISWFFSDNNVGGFYSVVAETDRQLSLKDVLPCKVLFQGPEQGPHHGAMMPVLIRDQKQKYYVCFLGWMEALRWRHCPAPSLHSEHGSHTQRTTEQSQEGFGSLNHSVKIIAWACLLGCYVKNKSNNLSH